MDKVQFKDIVERIKGIYGNRFNDLVGGAKEGWYECLEDLSYEDLKKAVVIHAKSSEFPPTVANLRNICNGFERKRIAVSAEIIGVYKFARNYYPIQGDDAKSQEVYLRVCGMDLAKAKQMQQDIIDFVRSIEEQCKPQEIQPFEDFLESKYGACL